MPVIAPSIIDGEAQTVIATWANLAGSDVGEAVRYSGAADRTVQMFGTFNGATVTMQGSLDGINWATLTDAQGTAIGMTANGLEAVTELVRFIRPSVSSGSGVDVTVLLMMRITR